MNQFIDSHIHLYDPEYDADLGEIISRAKLAGVDRCILPAIDSDTHDKMVNLAKLLPGFAFPCVGLHPTSVNAGWEKELTNIHENITRNVFYAVGEIGMDGYWSKEFMKEQSFVFEKQIELAVHKGLPVIIHSRDATDEIFKVLERTAHLGVKGVFHAFSGSYETYLRIKEMGSFKFGIGGVITFKNASLAKVAAKMDLQDIILETDGPWLTPAPFRGKRNEPSYISLIAEKLAETRGCSVEEIAAVTTKNAETLFNI